MKRARLKRAVGRPKRTGERLAREDMVRALRAVHDTIIVVSEALRAGRGIAVEEAADLLVRHAADELYRVLEALER